MARPHHLAQPISPAHAALAAVLATGAAFCIALNLPGQFSPDSIWQLQQGRSGVYNSWHPPVMAWLLGLFDHLCPGAPGFVVFDSVLGFGALLAIAALPPRPGWTAVGFAALLCASPLLLIYQGDVWKDVLFADAALAGFASLAWSARLRPRRAARFCLGGLSIALFALAALSRQNGLIALVGGASCVGGLRLRRQGRPWPAVAAAASFMAAGLGLVAAGDLALAARSDGEPAGAQQLELLQAWDLSGALHADPRLRLPILAARAPEAAAFVGRAAAPWTPERLDGLLARPGESQAMDGSGEAMTRQWMALILNRTALYARVRAADFLDLAATPDLMQCRPLFIGVDGPPEMLKALGLSARQRPNDAWARRYGLAFVGTPVISHLAYGALALLLLILCVHDLRGGASEDRIVIAALLASALAFAASFFVIGVACDYRYLYFLDLAVMAALLHRAAAGVGRLRWRSRPSEG
jgi:hypothetical protein